MLFLYPLRRSIFPKSSIWLCQGLEMLQYWAPCSSVKPRLLIMINKVLYLWHSVPCLSSLNTPTQALFSSFTKFITDSRTFFAFLSLQAFACVILLCLECPSPSSLPRKLFLVLCDEAQTSPIEGSLLWASQAESITPSSEFPLLHLYPNSTLAPTLPYWIYPASHVFICPLRPRHHFKEWDEWMSTFWVEMGKRDSLRFALFPRQNMGSWFEMGLFTFLRANKT